MIFMSEFSQPQIVWYGLIDHLKQIREYIAILKVFNEICPNLPNRFLRTSKTAVEKQLLLDIAKIFDPARYRGDENCSIELLKELCLNAEKEDSRTPKFPNRESNPLIIRIDEAYRQYESVISKQLRNKKMAHNDLYAMFNGTFLQASFDQVVILVENCSTIISEIGERLLGAKLKFSTIADLEKTYEDSLKDLIGNEQKR